MLKAILCGYSDVYVLVTVAITITRAEANASAKQGDEKINQ